jgi:general secretion pathway protein J
MRRGHLEPGFTLVEMLVALVIFGVIAGVAYRTLDASLAARTRVTAEHAQWREVVRAMTSIQRDLEAVEPRSVRLGAGGVAPALIGAPARLLDGYMQQAQPLMALTRAGDPEGVGRALAPRRVAYQVRDGALELLTWPALDQPTQSAPVVTMIANGIADAVFRYRDVGGRWVEMWPPAPPGGHALPLPPGQVSTAAEPTLPVGVEVTLVLTSGARVTRLIPIPARTAS